jgi:hypothetical protein
MQELSDFLHDGAYTSWAFNRVNLAQVDFNAVLRFVLNCKEQPVDKFDSVTDQVLLKINNLTNPEARTKFRELLGAIPLPNPRVTLASAWAGNTKGIHAGKGSTVIICDTVGDLLNSIGSRSCRKLSGWPVPRRVGQNVGLYKANTGLRVTVEYSELFQ